MSGHFFMSLLSSSSWLMQWCRHPGSLSIYTGITPRHGLDPPDCNPLSPWHSAQPASLQPAPAASAHLPFHTASLAGTHRHTWMMRAACPCSCPPAWPVITMAPAWGPAAEA